jgi:23S rRNA (cytosine1962-C5)-methyltransferase
VQVADALKGGHVRVDGRLERNGKRRVSPAVLVEVSTQLGQAPTGPFDISILEQGTDWIVVRKPPKIGCHPAGSGHPAGSERLSAVDLLADRMDRESATLWPVHRLDADVGGVWLVATSAAAAARLGRHFEEQRVEKWYAALVATPAWSAGELTGRVDRKSARTDYAVVETRDRLSRLSVQIHTGRTHQIRRHLSGMGCPIIGDALYGGVMVSGGIRLHSAALRIPAEGIDVASPIPAGFWPSETVYVAVNEAKHSITVSDATITALERGHPWVLTDTETSDVGGFLPGTLMKVRSQSRKNAGLVRAEGLGRIAARVWSDGGGADSLEQRVDRALSRRRRLFDQEGASTLYRLIHGEADGLPGLFMDRLGPVLRVLIRGRCALPLVGPVTDRIQHALGHDGPVIQVTHLTDRPSGRLLSVEQIRGSAHEPGRFEVRERGLCFWVDAGLAEPYRSRPGFGLFADQRENRERLGRLAQGGRWLNLFSHTGAFSVALLAAGARSVWSVDLSGTYLSWLNDNLALNDLADERHRSFKMDARRFLTKQPGDERFDGVILDPPTAAASGRRFWSIRKGGAELIAGALRCLAPGGHLLMCRNDRRARGTLEPLIKEVAKGAGIRLRSLVRAGPGLDFPILEGFPEGDAFHGILVQIAS